MPLGLAKDSMLKLSELVKEKEEFPSTAQPLPTPAEEGQEIVTVLPATQDGSKDSSSVAGSVSVSVSESEADVRAFLASGKLLNGGNGGLSSSASSFDSDHKRNGTASPVPPSLLLSSEASVASADSGSKAGNKKEATTASESGSSYGAYAGFAVDYKDYDQYVGYGLIGKESLVPTNLDAYSIRPTNGFWCCVFPWLAKQEDDDDDDLYTDPAASSDSAEVSASLPRSASQDDDEVSTGSGMLGERLSDKERQAVLARLRLAQPDVPKIEGSNSGSSTSLGNKGGGNEQPKKGLLNDIIQPEKNDGRNRKRGILKRPSTMQLQDNNDGNAKDDSSTHTNAKGDGTRRRSLFPVYDNKKTAAKNLNVAFSPMARVISVKSHKDMSEDEKGDVWWQKSDYEAFRKTGRMITKAMLEGGSEIWLASNQSWHTPNQNRATTLKNAYNLSRSSQTKQQIKQYERTRDKWWHKFGHSRRGLEHIASIDEGRQRQGNVRAAIQAVIDEQRRQKVFHREDAEKLRMVSIQHTSWARDLAAAAAASDQDAVKAEFDDDNRKSREFYLIKFARSSITSTAPTSHSNVPAFMKPMLQGPPTTNRLDANTTSQIRYRRSQKKKAVAAATSTSTESSVPEPPAKETSEPVRSSDKSGGDAGSSMAKRAAGFASGEEVANMSAVLSGMGPVPKNVSAVGGP